MGNASAAAPQGQARLGRYELLARLATGGMGEIFLARLEGAGLIEALAERGARRPYRLTPAGTKQLRAELESLKGLTRAATRRLAAR